MTGKYTPPKPTKDDHYAAAAKVAANMLPVIGGAAAELMNFVITPTLETRRNEWMIMIGEALERLENEKGLSIESLKNNEEFIDVFLETSRIAIRTSQKEKHELLRNVILNAVIKEYHLNSPLESIFLSCLDEFSILHIKMLLFFAEESHQLYLNKYSHKNLTTKDFLKIKFDSIDNDALEIVWNSLQRKSMFETKSYVYGTAYGDSYISQNKPSVTLSNTGKKFLEYISSPFKENG